MMSEITTAAFLAKGSSGQFRYVLSLYDEALRLKAESKSKKPQELIKLDQWYQKEFPTKIKARGKDPHIIHDELVTIMKWKLARGKFRPRLKELVTMNSPRVVETESRKAFRALFKKDDLGASIQYLCNLKGIGPATASAIVTAAAPERAAFMADECLAAVPEIEGIDYTLQEYLEMLKHIQQAVIRLGGPDEWNPHQIELALWTHHILLTYKPILLQDMPDDTIPPQEDSLGSTMSSDSKEILFNHDSGGDSNGTSNVDYNYDLEQSSSFVTNDEDTLDNVVALNSKSIHSDANSAVVTQNNNHHSIDGSDNILLGTNPSAPVPVLVQVVDTDKDSVVLESNLTKENNIVHLDDVSTPATLAGEKELITVPQANSTVVENTSSDQEGTLPNSETEPNLNQDQNSDKRNNDDEDQDYPQTKKPKLTD